MAGDTPLVLGCDFSSSPSKTKPIVIALGQLEQGRVRLNELHTFPSLNEWGE